MKKSFLVFALIAATSLFSADLSSKSSEEILNSLDSKNIENFADGVFEIKKRASKANTELSELCTKMHNLMRNEMQSRPAEEAKKFMEDFHAKMNAKIANLSPEEKANFDFRACKNFHHANFKNGGCNMMGGMEKCGMQGKMGPKMQNMPADCPMHKNLQKPEPKAPKKD